MSLAPFRIGKGSSFSPFMGSCETDGFKDVHLMDPEAPNIFHRALCRQKQRLGKKEMANFLQKACILALSAGLLSAVRNCESSFFF